MTIAQARFDIRRVDAGNLFLTGKVIPGSGWQWTIALEPVGFGKVIAVGAVSSTDIRDMLSIVEAMEGRPAEGTLSLPLLEPTLSQQTSSSGSWDSALKRLTPTQRKVAEHLVAGTSNKEIGRTMGISPRTVEVHRARIFRRLEVRNAIDLALLRGGQA